MLIPVHCRAREIEELRKQLEERDKEVGALKETVAGLEEAAATAGQSQQ